MDLGTLMTTFGANLSPLQAAVVKAVSELEKFDKEGRKALESINTASVKTASAIDKVSTAVKFAAAAFGVYKIAEYAKDAALAAARFETLGIVMTTVGKNSGYTTTQMAGFATALQKTGISMTESYSVITKMAQAQLDLTKSTELARVAQDAAVIGNLNSSDALARMVQGIQSAEVEILRTIGINVSFEDSYTKLADKLGKTSKELTETEKTTARLNAVLAAGPAIAGVYEASMDTASKQLKTMERYAADLQVMLGKVFTPALSAVVGQINEQWKVFNADVKKSEQTIQEWGQTVLDIVDVAVKAFGLLGEAIYGVQMIFGDMKSAVGGMIAGGGLQNQIKEVTDALNTAKEELASEMKFEDSDVLSTRVTTLTKELKTLTDTQQYWLKVEAEGEALSTKASKSHVGLGMSVQELSQKIQYAGSIEKKALDDKKKAIDDQTSSEMTLKGIAEQRWQSEQKQANDKKYKDYLDNTTDSIVQQDKAYEKLVARLKKDPVYEAYANSGQQDKADDWLDKKIKELNTFEKQGEKSEKAAQKLAIALQEMHSKFAESESDEYAKGIADLDKEYLKLQQSLKGSAEGLAELDKWYNKKRTELTFAKDIETLTTLNEKLKAADTQLNQLTMTTEEYTQYSIDAEFESQMTALMALNEVTGTYSGVLSELIDKYTQIRDLKKAKAFLSEEDTEIYFKMQNALQDVDDKIAQLTMSSKEYSEYSLSRQFEKDMNAALAGGYATEEYRKKLEEYYKLVKKTNQTLKKEIEQIYEQMWKNIQSTFADTIYDMFDKGIDGFSGFFDKVMELFKKMLAQMVSAWLVSGLKTLLTGGEGAFSLSSLFSMGSTGVSATDAAEGALSLASAYDSLAAGLTYVTDALGLTTVAATTAAESVASAAAVQAKSTAAAAATMEGIANSATYAATATEALGSAAVETSAAMTNSVASFEALEASLNSSLTTTAGGTAAAEMSAMSTLGAAAAVAGVVYFIGSGAFEEVVGGLFGYSDQSVSTEDMESALRAAEAGFITLSEETQNLYKTMILGLDEEWDTARQEGGYTNNETGAYQYSNDIYNLTQDWYDAHEELLHMTMAEYDKLMAQQAELNSVATDTWQEMQAVMGNAGDYGYENANDPYGDTMGQAYVELAVKIADDATLPLEQKMYQLGFVAKDSGGWQSDATMAMLAEFSDQGVPWSEINKVLTDIGALGANEDVIKNIYAVYHGVSYWPTWESVEAALTAVGYDSEVIKAIKTEFSGDMTYDELSKLIYDAYTSPDMLAEVMVMIDPSDEWKDLVIPVDAPDSIPVSWDGQPMGMATGGPVSAGTPYIIGEVGPELFVPQESGHILSNANMKKLMGMGVKGFASGTTSASISGSGSSYETLAEWQADYNKQLEEYLGLTTDLGDALSDISDYYTEQEQIAKELGATEEELAAIRADGAEVWMKAIEDWYASEEEYYNEMMGLNTELGDALSETEKHYAEAIASAEAAGMAEEALADIRSDAADVWMKNMEDWYESEEQYYNRMMGIDGLADTLSEIENHYGDVIAAAAEAGMSDAELAALMADGAEVWMKAIQDWYDSLEDYYNDMMGLSTELGDTLAGIQQFYDAAISDAIAAGLSQAELAGIQADAAAVMQKTIEDWYASYEDYVSAMMGLTTALGDQIAAINEYYANAMAEADVVDPTGALSDSMAADQAAMIQKAIDDFYQSELDYYNDLMGLNTELGDTLSGISQHYDAAIASAEAAGMAEEDLAALREMEAAAAQKAIEDWYKSYEDYYNSMMGLTTALGDQIAAINEYYAAMMADADIADPTGATSADMAADQAAMIQKALDDAVAAYEDYYNSMMGLTTALGDEIDKINDYYAEQIANANAVDPTGAAAAELAADQAAMIQKAIEDWAQSYSDYVDDMLGNTSRLADDLAKVNEYYAEQLATAEEIGMTEAEINQMLADQAAIQQQILEDYVKEYNEWLLDTLGIHNNLADSLNSITGYYDQMLIDLDAIEASDEAINQLLAQEQAVLEVIAYQTLADMAKTMAEINGYATEMSSQLSDIAKQYAQMLKDAYTLVQMDLARPITLAIIAMSAGLSLLNVVGKSRADAEAQAIEDIAKANQDRYDAESKAIDDLKGQMDDLQNIVDSITKKMQDLKYGKFNLTLPSQTMANAEGDYAALLAKAQTGDADAVAAYMDFVDTYLQSAQNQYKSSGDYQAIYDQVMKDLAGVQENAQDQLTLDQQLLMAMEAELASIAGTSGTTAENTDALVEAQETVFSNIAAVLTSAASVLDDFVANYAEELPLLTAAIDRVATAMEAMAERLTEISDWFIEGMTNGFTADGFVKTVILDIYTKISTFVDRLNDIGNVIYTIGLYIAKFFPTLSEKMIEVGAELATLSPSLQDFFADMKVLIEYIKSLQSDTSSEYAAKTAENTTTISNELFALNRYLKVPGYEEIPGYASGGISTGPTSGYPVTLHGTEAIIPLSGGAIPVTLSGGQSDPEVKALLQELVAVSRGKQNVTLTTEDGATFRGYIRREADTVRIEAASRPGMETKRIYN